MGTTTLLVGMALGLLPLEEPPARPGMWGYQPADGAIVRVNPPALTWVPVDDAVHYEVQLAATPAGQAEAFNVSGLTEPVYVHDVPVPDNKRWIWRWRAYMPNPEPGGEPLPTEWSAPRRFVLEAGAVTFPKPTRAQQAERVPDGHPRVLFSAEQVPELKALREGALEADWAAIVGEADRLLASPPDTSEPPRYPDEVEYKSGEWKEIWWGNRKRAIAVADGAATC